MTPCVVCQSPEHRTGDHVWTEEDGAREVAALSRPATDHGITNAILRQEHTPRPATDPAGLDVLLAEGIEAFRLTREYVGEDTLPAIEGWSWFDWTEKAKARLSVADGPGPQERLRDALATANSALDAHRPNEVTGRCVACGLQWFCDTAGLAMLVIEALTLPVHREETGHEPGPRATVLVEDQERPLIWIEGRQDD